MIEYNKDVQPVDKEFYNTHNKKLIFIGIFNSMYSIEDVYITLEEEHLNIEMCLLYRVFNHKCNSWSIELEDLNFIRPNQKTSKHILNMSFEDLMQKVEIIKLL